MWQRKYASARKQNEKDYRALRTAVGGRFSARRERINLIGFMNFVDDSNSLRVPDFQVHLRVRLVRLYNSQCRPVQLLRVLAVVGGGAASQRVVRC